MKVRQIIGILTENPSLYERLTAYENMDFFAEAYGLSNTQENGSNEMTRWQHFQRNETETFDRASDRA